jgi:uncharacterized protein (DUF58 family)
MSPAVPTDRAVAVLAIGMLPAVLGIVNARFGLLALGVDLGVAVLCVIDFLLAPEATALRAERKTKSVLSSGVLNPVAIRLELKGRKPIQGTVRDSPPPEVASIGHRGNFKLDAATPEAELTYKVLPSARGDLRFGDLHLRLLGPLGLCARQQTVRAAETVKVYPDLSALTRDALALARSAEQPSARTLRRFAEGREFESLREYRYGDDSRVIDWKATARRGKPIVRAYQPDRHQWVMILLDAGRHMTGRVAGRRKLDHTVDAALRLAKVSLDGGDQVGILSFATEIRSFLPPRRGRDHLRSIAESLYRVEPAFEESDYGGAVDFALRRIQKRALVVVLTDLLDPDSSAALVARALALRPRHLPLIISLLDEDLQTAATSEPKTVQEAYVRDAANRIEADYRLTAARLRNSGALLLRVPARTLSAETVNEYLRVKARGLL